MTHSLSTMPHIIRKNLAAVLILLPVAVGIFGCAHRQPDTQVPPVKQALAAGLQNQVIRPLGARDPSPVLDMPGTLAYQIHQQRYIKAMTADQDDDKQDKASREFQ